MFAFVSYRKLCRIRFLVAQKAITFLNSSPSLLKNEALYTVYA